MNVFGLGVAGLGGSLLKDVEDDQTVGSTLFRDLSAKIGIGGESVFDNEDQEAARLRKNLVPKDKFDLKATSQAGLAIATQELSKLAGVDISADEFLARSTGRILNPNRTLFQVREKILAKF